MVDRTYQVSRKKRRPPKPYDLTMWTRKCNEGVRSCFKIVGNWDNQKPVFRGCAESKHSHGQFCKREMMTVEVAPGKPKVAVRIKFLDSFNISSKTFKLLLFQG